MCWHAFPSLRWVRQVAEVKPSNLPHHATRAALTQVIREAATYMTEKGVAKKTAPVMISMLEDQLSRFGLELSEKAAAELVPVAGSAGGLTLNVLFARHFHSIAEGHFTIRRLRAQIRLRPNSLRNTNAFATFANPQECPRSQVFRARNCQFTGQMAFRGTE